MPQAMPINWLMIFSSLNLVIIFSFMLNFFSKSSSLKSLHLTPSIFSKWLW